MPTVVSCSLLSDHGPHLQILPQAGFDVRVTPRDEDLFDEDRLIEVLDGAVAVLAGSEPYTRRVIESLPNLRVIARTGVGYDAIDLEACDEHGVVVTITPGVNHESVAEHTIALLMGVARGFPDLDRRVRENDWERIPYPRVMGSTLGLVGLGRIGQAVARRARGLGMKLLGYDPFVSQEAARQQGIELTELDDLLARSDFVSLHLPLSAETRHLINDTTLQRMKPGSVLINTARGGLVDEKALCRALESGHLRGAGLDVFEVEPLPLDSPLLKFPHVLLSGHVAGLDTQSFEDTFRMAAETIIALSRGEWPRECIVNLKGVQNWSWDRRTG